jgi:hypothetical protein
MVMGADDVELARAAESPTRFRPFVFHFPAFSWSMMPAGSPQGPQCKPYAITNRLRLAHSSRRLLLALPLPTCRRKASPIRLMVHRVVVRPLHSV